MATVCYDKYLGKKLFRGATLAVNGLTKIAILTTQLGVYCRVRGAAQFKNYVLLTGGAFGMAAVNLAECPAQIITPGAQAYTFSRDHDSDAVVRQAVRAGKKVHVPPPKCRSGGVNAAEFTCPP
jgi:hypothetical protein